MWAPHRVVSGSYYEPTSFCPKAKANGTSSPSSHSVLSNCSLSSSLQFPLCLLLKVPTSATFVTNPARVFTKPFIFPSLKTLIAFKLLLQIFFFILGISRELKSLELRTLLVGLPCSFLLYSTLSQFSPSPSLYFTNA